MEQTYKPYKPNKLKVILLVQSEFSEMEVSKVAREMSIRCKD